MPTRALITGIKGQDGSYLAEVLLSMGYEVHGLVRRPRDVDLITLHHMHFNLNGGQLYLHFGDMADTGRLTQLIYDVQPDEVYNLAAQSHVRMSFDTAVYTGDVTGLGVVRLLEAIRASGVGARFYQASSSEMFGASPPPQNEATPFSPRSPYAVAKAYAYWMTTNYRQGY
ncbi:MAG: GDP-mannose 4,6-dehydratase, partial [Dehalococcoidia bacterium]